MEEVKYLYRYEETRWSLGVDQFDDPLPGYKLTVDLHKYRIVKYTPKGMWVVPNWCLHDDEEKLYRKFVRKEGNKRFAWETEEQALESFMCRKKAQLRILNAQVSQVKRAIAEIERMQGKGIWKTGGIGSMGTMRRNSDTKPSNHV